MDEMKKLLKKVSKKDRGRLKETVKKLIAGDHKGLKIKKIRSLDCFRIRVGRFRIFFKVIKGRIEIVDIKLRNEMTYK